MTENELRLLVVNTAKSYLGCKESDGSHRKIIDLYNSHKPLARGYAVKYTDAWCSTFASAIAIACGLTDIIPTECGCEKHIQLFKAKGSWVENDAYVPKIGDYIFYDWQDGANYATTDNTGSADHIGIVIEVSGNNLVTIEGNMSNAVGCRRLIVNGRYIRGYGTPNYAAKAASMGAGNAITPPKVETPVNDNSKAYAIGAEVEFTGTSHYSSAAATTGKPCKPGKAKITNLAPGKPHPIHCVAVHGEGSTVYGWVNEADLKKDSTTFKIGDRVKVLKAVTYIGKPFKAYAIAYDVIQVNDDRVVIGIGTAVTAAVKAENLQKV